MENEELNGQEFEKAIKLLNDADITRVSFDAKKQAFIKLYKALTPEKRMDLCVQSAQMLHTKHNTAGRLDGLTFVLMCGLAHERDWDSAMKFLNTMLSISSDTEFFREFSIVLLEISDNELSDRQSRLPLAHTCLVVLTEFGLLLASRAGQSRLDNLRFRTCCGLHHTACWLAAM